MHRRPQEGSLDGPRTIGPRNLRIEPLRFGGPTVTLTVIHIHRTSSPRGVRGAKSLFHARKRIP